MRIVALLSFYNERTEDLERLIHSLKHAGVTRLVALDGAYALYPNPQPASSPAEHNTLRQAARAAGIQLHLRIPPTPWIGNEVEKRTAMFELAEKVTTPQDWYLVIDGDEHIIEPCDLSDLEHTTFDVAEITYTETKTNGQTYTVHSPRLFRAIRGLHCFRNHYTYRTPDGRLLWGNVTSDPLEPRHVAHQLHMRHEPRDWVRRRQAMDYYTRRDQRGIEAGHCQLCDDAKATQRLYTNIRPHGKGYAADVLELCNRCSSLYAEQNRAAANSLGLDPTTLQPHNIAA